MRLREMWKLLKDTFSEWQFKQVSLLASSLAYYTVFSLAPILVIVIAIAGLIFGEAAAQGEIVSQLQDLIGTEGAQLLQTAIANTRENHLNQGILGLIVNIGFLIFGASTVFIQLQRSLNRIWEVEPEPGRNIVSFLRKRLLSLAMILVIAFLLLVSFTLNATLVFLINFLRGNIPGLVYLWEILNFLVSLGIITLLFASIYKILPDAKIEWRDVGVGAFITALLFMLGQYLFSLFIGYANLGSAYGVAGSFVIVITWVFYSANILFMGAEFTQVYAKKHGSGLVPEEHAESVDSEDSPSHSERKKAERNSRKNKSRGLFSSVRRSLTRLLRRLKG